MSFPFGSAEGNIQLIENVRFSHDYLRPHSLIDEWSTELKNLLESKSIHGVKNAVRYQNPLKVHHTSDGN